MHQTPDLVEQTIAWPTNMAYFVDALIRAKTSMCWHSKRHTAQPPAVHGVFQNNNSQSRSVMLHQSCQRLQKYSSKLMVFQAPFSGPFYKRLAQADGCYQNTLQFLTFFQLIRLSTNSLM